jgi:hypothetical protein
MRSRLARLGMVFGTLAAASTLISGPAGAQTPAVFGGSATGTALNLSIAGNNLTGGVSLANAKSTLVTDAEGTGILTPGLTQDLKTSVNANNQTQNKPFACAGALPALPGPLGALSLKAACSSSSSSVAGNNPVANASGLVALAGLSNLSALPGLPAALDQISSNVGKVPTLGPIVQNVLKSIAAGQVIDAPLGPSHSSVTTDAGTVVSKASADGATVNLLSVAPLPADNAAGAAKAAPATPALKPLLTLTLGSATATATYDRHTGKSSGTFDPALLTITQNTGLPGLPVTTKVVPGQSIDFPPAGSGSPVLLSIKVGDGSSKTNPDGSVSSVADGVSIAVLPGQASGKDVLDLQLAHAQASVGGALATVDAPPHPPTLPFTGEHPWIPYAGGGFLAGALGLGFLAYRGGFRFGFRRP